MLYRIVLLIVGLFFTTGCGTGIPDGYVLVTVTPAETTGGVAGSPAATAEATGVVPTPTTSAPLGPAAPPDGTVRDTTTTNGETAALPLPTTGRIAVMGPLPQSEALHVFVANADGTGLTHVSESSQEEYYPSLSPDGTRVAFVASGEGSADIFVATIATGVVVNITSKAGADNQPVWSPDGTTLAFTSDRDGGDVDIWVMASDGTGARRVARTPGEDSLGGWSPDGRTLVFSNRNEIGESLWTVAVDSGEFTPLTPQEANRADRSPVWSPDGSEIAFFRDDGSGVARVHTITPEGTRLTPLGDETVTTIFPVYSPDSAWLLYTSVVGEQQVVTALDRTSGIETRYPELLGFATSWVPASDTLADTGLVQGIQNTGVVVDSAVVEAAYKLGADTAPVQIIEFSDYQCPFCQRWYNETFPLLQPYIENGTVQLVFVDFPLTIHDQADEAAQAARCVGNLGGSEGYWSMHNLLFENLSTWSGNPQPAPIFAGLATQVGVDQGAVEACVTQGTYAPAVQAGLAEGSRLGVTGTPTFFINGDRVVGAQPWSVFETAIQQAVP